MRLPGFRSRSRTEPAHEPSVGMLTIRVAMAASAIVLVAYPVQAGNGQPFGPTGAPDRPFGPQVAMWRISPDGTIVALNNFDITLPVEYRHVTGPETVTIGGAAIRIEGAARGEDYVVVGETMEDVNTAESTLIVSEFGIGCALLIVVFLGAWAIGRRVATPIERARRRQLEFTADASHELRTPLSVIEAQATLAIARPRDPERDASAFGRINVELKRTRRLVDDMLWLARFDSTGGQPQAEPVDLRVLAAQTADRFGAVAETRKLHLEVQAGSATTDSIVTAPPEWLDLLVGILLDNACKYSPQGGSVIVGVTGEGRRVRLTVDDSGPGIPEDERARIFDRFHRATDQPGGSGLGLAIGAAIVRATGGRWQIGTSAAGGASVSVSWPRSMSSHGETP